MRTLVLVHGHDADHLLNLEATDLRHNLQVKAKLEQKLWTLWGNLEELKTEGKWTEAIKPANHPFECNVDEFGVWEGDDAQEVGEWKRMLRLKQTVIWDS